VPRGALPLCPSVAERVSSYTLKYPCAILPPDLIFENVRQRVGCGSLLTLNLREMSIAVDERFSLTAKRLRNHDYISIWDICKHRILSGGIS